MEWMASLITSQANPLKRWQSACGRGLHARCRSKLFINWFGSKTILSRAGFASIHLEGVLMKNISHLLLFLRPEEVELATDIFHEYALQVDGSEPGAAL
jgi:hypothetical protein